MGATGASRHLGHSVAAAPPRSAPPTPTPSSPAPVGIAATSTSGSVAVYDETAGAVVETLANPIPAGALLTFLVSAGQGD